MMQRDADYWLEHPLEWFAHITPEAIEDALCGFSLDTRMSNRWLAGHIRRVYFSTVSDGVENYPGQAKIRQDLSMIAAALDNAIEKFDGRGGWAESVLRRFASLQQEDGIKGLFEESRPNPFLGDLTENEKVDPLYLKEKNKVGAWAEDSIKLARDLSGWHVVSERT